MEDEVFRECFKKLLIQVNNFFIAMQKQDTKEADKYQNKIKQLLEEIWQDGYEHGEPAKWTIYRKGGKRR